MKSEHLPRQAWDKLASRSLNEMIYRFASRAFRSSEEMMLEAVEDAIRLTQDNDEAVSFGCAFARVLAACITGSTPLEAVDAVATELRRPGRSNPQADDRFVATQLQVRERLLVHLLQY
jgi:hypothetical protein